MLEALSCDFCSGFSLEDLFADDLGIIGESFEESVRRLLTWKEAIEEKGLSKCMKDNDHDLCYRPRPPAEFRKVSVRSLSHWSGQQLHLLKQLQSTECTRNAEGSSAWQRTLITVVHSARELQVDWTADHRGKFKSNLLSWRW